MTQIGFLFFNSKNIYHAIYRLKIHFHSKLIIRKNIIITEFWPRFKKSENEIARAYKLIKVFSALKLRQNL